MANIGAIDEIVNNENLLLQVGADTFILMQDCRFNLDRPVVVGLSISSEVVTTALILLYYLAHLK